MADEITAERVLNNARASAIPITSDIAARIAQGINPTAARFRKGKLSVPFEDQPASYVVTATADADR